MGFKLIQIQDSDSFRLMLTNLKLLKKKNPRIVFSSFYYAHSYKTKEVDESYVKHSSMRSKLDTKKKDNKFNIQ